MARMTTTTSSSATATLPKRKTKTFLERLKQINETGLQYGSHREPPKGVTPEGCCVMEAVAYVAGEEWSDHPECACRVITRFLVGWNDGMRNNAEREILKPLIPKIIGSRSTLDVEMTRAWMAADWLAHTWVPAWLEIGGFPNHASRFRELGPVVDLESCNKVWQRVEKALPDIAAREKGIPHRFKGSEVLDMAGTTALYAVNGATRICFNGQAETIIHVHKGWAQALIHRCATIALDKELKLVTAGIDLNHKATIKRLFGPTEESLRKSAYDLVLRMLDVQPGEVAK